jgi:tetratricopeptide (TPR) repeat protein
MIVLLMGDLIRIGRPAEVVKWEHDLPESVRQSPRLSVAVAEALRLTGEWAALKSWVERAHWTAQSEFMHTMYRMDAAHGLGDRSGLADAYKELKEQVQDNGAFALFAGVNLYTTGMQAEAVPLFWAAADSPNVAMDALGTLARHYQSEHDAVGQYQAFRRLHALRPEDPGIANNYAYFAVVAGQFNFNEIERIVRENHLREPANPLYLANYAFLLQATGRVQAALDLVQPRAEVWRQSEPFAFAYGLVLAADGRKTEAREVLARIKPEPLSVQERELLRSALN